MFSLSYQRLLLHLQPVPSVPGSFYPTSWLLTPVNTPLLQENQAPGDVQRTM